MRIAQPPTIGRRDRKIDMELNQASQARDLRQKYPAVPPIENWRILGHNFVIRNGGYMYINTHNQPQDPPRRFP